MWLPATNMLLLILLFTSNALPAFENGLNELKGPTSKSFVNGNDGDAGRVQVPIKMQNTFKNINIENIFMNLKMEFDVDKSPKSTQKPTPKPAPRVCYTFPVAATKANVKLTPKVDKTLAAFTFDIFFNMTKKHGFYNNGGNYILDYEIGYDDEFEVDPDHGFYMRSGYWTGGFAAQLNVKTRLTVVYDASSWTIYENGVLKKKGNKYVHKIRSGGFWMLGQEMDNYGGSFKENQRFIGTLCEFQMWSKKLSDTELSALFRGEEVERGDIFDNPTTKESALAEDGAVISIA